VKKKEKQVVYCVVFCQNKSRNEKKSLRCMPL